LAEIALLESKTHASSLDSRPEHVMFKNGLEATFCLFTRVKLHHTLDFDDQPSGAACRINSLDRDEIWPPLVLAEGPALVAVNSDLKPINL